MKVTNDRRKHPLFTLDRALLIGAFTLGSFVAAREFKAADLQTTVAAIAVRVSASELKIQTHDVSDAETRTELRYIRENLQKLAESTAKFVNVVRDQDKAIRVATQPRPDSPE